MREQVIVLPPSVERRRTIFSLGKKEEAFLSTTKEISWAGSEGEDAEQISGFVLIERDHKQAVPAELCSAENMKPPDAKQASTEPSIRACEDVKQAKPDAEGSERMRNSPCCNEEGAPLLQWGLRKRSRCSRGDTHNPGGRLDKHNCKPSSLVDESSVLYRKTVRVQADRAVVAQPNTNSHASKGILKAKNGVTALREHLLSEEKQNQQDKALKGGQSDVKQGTKRSLVGGGKRGYPPLPRQNRLLQQSRTFSLPDPNLPPKDRSVTPLPGSNDAILSKDELVWPRLIIGLSRKEKEEDFFLLKGTKLPQRPKRRPKVVEKALNYCCPGSWLVDISPSRYDVREKRPARKKAKGLKAMESLDSDSD